MSRSCLKPGWQCSPRYLVDSASVGTAINSPARARRSTPQLFGSSCCNSPPAAGPRTPTSIRWAPRTHSPPPSRGALHSRARALSDGDADEEDEPLVFAVEALSLSGEAEPAPLGTLSREEVLALSMSALRAAIAARGDRFKSRDKSRLQERVMESAAPPLGPCTDGSANSQRAQRSQSRNRLVHPPNTAVSVRV
mmetsp:Transcript_41557/g.137712  ORF Transcript_41557/g.137712 Transcript_41557/m.137712 type:complete len:195 (-) Transcript_41557:121-705(-)